MTEGLPQVFPVLARPGTALHKHNFIPEGAEASQSSDFQPASIISAL